MYFLPPVTGYSTPSIASEEGSEPEPRPERGDLDVPPPEPKRGDSDVPEKTSPSSSPSESSNRPVSSHHPLRPARQPSPRRGLLRPAQVPAIDMKSAPRGIRRRYSLNMSRRRHTHLSSNFTHRTINRRTLRRRTQTCISHSRRETSQQTRHNICKRLGRFVNQNSTEVAVGLPVKPDGLREFPPLR
jgi:hypothetical protein